MVFVVHSLIQLKMKMLIYYILLIIILIPHVITYSNNLYTISSLNKDEYVDGDCGSVEAPAEHEKLKLSANTPSTSNEFHFKTIKTTPYDETDPLKTYQNFMLQFLFGSRGLEHGEDMEENGKKYALALEIQPKEIAASDENYHYVDDALAQFPKGNVLRAEMFQNKTAVHLPMAELMHRGHCFLKITPDYMQTAVDAFAILLHGTLADVMRLPRLYVLRSARTIAMMKIAKEKLAATWKVVKGGDRPQDVTYQTLELYRPLFKFLNGREMARLNLNDDRILTFIGTHADLDRHQVGVIASKYIQINKRWMEPHFLNMMNNLLCGVPMTFMRRIPESTYLQLTHQIFYHIRACDPLQRRFYLSMMTRTQALGKSYSWSARDVSRLGLLLSGVEGPDLAAINPEAMSGITAQVMLELPPQNLEYITEMQLRYIGQKPLNILAKRMRIYQEQLEIFNAACRLRYSVVSLMFALKLI